MKRSELEKYLGTKVKVVLHGGDFVTGILGKTEDVKDDPNYYLNPKYYFVSPNIRHLIFRCSHVKKIEVQE